MFLSSVERSAQIETLKSRLVGSMAERTRNISSGEQTVVGVNSFTESEPSPLGGSEAILRVDPAVETETIADLETWRNERDQAAVEQALDDLETQPSMAGTSWKPLALQLPEEPQVNGVRPCEMSLASTEPQPVSERQLVLITRCHRWQQRSGKCREARRDYLSPSPVSTDTQMELSRSQSQLEIREWKSSTQHSINDRSNCVDSLDEDPDVIGLSILSGSHLELVPELVERVRSLGVDAPIIVGGIIPDEDNHVSSTTVSQRSTRRKIMNWRQS